MIGRIIILWGVVLGLAPVSAAAVEPDQEAVDRVVRQALRAWKMPGVAVAVVRGDRIVYLAGHGVRTRGGEAPVTPDTLFPLASCTKAFTATGLAQLVDEGKIRWDDPVRKHLPWFHLSDPLADSDVRIEDLLSHRTGLGGHDLLWYRSPWSQEEIIRRAGKLPLERPFRTTFLYQTSMFTAAGHVLAKASGQSWGDFIRGRLLEPLRMKSAVLTSKEAEAAPDRASPHRLDRDGQPEVDVAYPMESPEPAGSLHASVRDMAHWLQFQVNGGLFEGRRLLSSEQLRETHSPRIAVRLEGTTRNLNPETSLMSYGLGWLLHDYRGHGLVSHAGLIDGYRAQITLVPKEKLGLVILCNMQPTRLNLALSNALVDLYLGLPPRDWNSLLLRVGKQEEAEVQARDRQRAELRARSPGPTAPLQAYMGSFDNPAYGVIHIRENSGRLILHWGMFSWPLEPLVGDQFSFRHEQAGLIDGEFLVERGQVKAWKAGAPWNAHFQRLP